MRRAHRAARRAPPRGHDAGRPDRRAGACTVQRADALVIAERHARNYAVNWRLAGDDREEARELGEEAIALLAAHRLLDDDGAALRPRPAICRYASATPSEPRRQASPAQEALL